MKRTLAIAVVLTLGAAAPASADTIYGVTATNGLVSFAPDRAGVLPTPLPITGLNGGDAIAAIDFRPATLQLYALGTSGQLYKVDTVTGVATTVGPPIPLSGTRFDADFNPVSDRLRVVSNNDQNLRVNPADGTVQVDTALTYAGGDPNSGGNPGIIAAAYTNNAPPSSTYPAAPLTQLLDIDTSLSVLAAQAPPNNGTLTTLGPLDVTVLPDVGGLDVLTEPDGTNIPYALLREAGDGRSRIYRINAATGRATPLSVLPAADDLVDIAVAPPVPTFVALTTAATQGLVTFRADRPETVSPALPVTGLQVGERLVGIDTRPATGELYGLGSTSRVYVIDPRTGAAMTLGGAFTPSLAGTSFGFDFNPFSDRLRIVSDANYNGRFTPTAPITSSLPAGDTALAYGGADPNAGQNPDVTASAYTSVVAGAETVTLFGIDTTLNALVVQAPPNDGTLSTVAGSGLGVNPTAVNGYDVVPQFNHHFAVFQLEGETVSKLFAVHAVGSPAIGSATLVGTLNLPAGVLAEGLATLNTDTIALAATTAGVDEGDVATLTILRPYGAGAGGGAAVTVDTALGSAEAEDFTAVSTVLLFGPGETTKTVSVPTAEDTTFEGDETFTVTLSAPTGAAALADPISATVTINEDDPQPAATASPTASASPSPVPTSSADPNPTPTAPPGKIATTLTVTVTPKRDRKKPYRFALRGRVRPASPAACSGTVRVTRGRASEMVDVKPKCRFASTLAVKSKKRRGTVRVTATYLGSSTLEGSDVVERTVSFGRKRA